MALYVPVLRNDLSKRACSPKQTRKGNMIILTSYRKNGGTVTVTFPKSCGKSVRMEPISIEYQCNSLSMQCLRKKKSTRALY